MVPMVGLVSVLSAVLAVPAAPAEEYEFVALDGLAIGTCHEDHWDFVAGRR
jgi:hypothetical protein